MHGLKTSMKTFIHVRTKIQTPHKPQISTKQNWLIRGDKRKCLVCKGRPRIVLGGRGKLAGFYSVDDPYPHKEGCRNK